MAEPSHPSSNRLELLYHLSQVFNSSLDLDEVLNRVIDEVIVAMQAERGFVMLYDDQGKLVFRIARGIDQTTIQEPRFQVSLSIVENVANDGEPVITSDAQSDIRFNMRQSVMILGLRSILCVPLKLKSQVLGAIYVDNRLQAGIFRQTDLELLSAIAATAAIAIENARLYQVAVEKGRLERELQMAYQVQVSLLPDSTPNFPGWEFAAGWLPARRVAGDYYDFFKVSGVNAENPHMGIVIADVTDKGMPAALFMALTRSTIRASLDRAATAAEGMTHANRLICNDAMSGMFVTLFFGRLDPDSQRFTYVNAGHNPPLLYQAKAGKLQRLGRTGMALGVDDKAAYEEVQLELEDGDMILFYTDGVTDAVDASMQEYGMDRLQNTLLQYVNASPAEVVSAVEESVSNFTGTDILFDDITLVVVRRGDVG